MSIGCSSHVHMTLQRDAMRAEGMAVEQPALDAVEHQEADGIAAAMQIDTKAGKSK